MDYPTTFEIYNYLVHDNGWEPIEVADLLEAHEDALVGNDAGDTTASRDQWTQWAQEMPESN